MTHLVYDSLHEALHEIRTTLPADDGPERQRLGGIAKRLAESIELYTDHYWQLVDERFRAVALLNLLTNWRRSMETDDTFLMQNALETTQAITGHKGDMAMALAEAYRVLKLKPPTPENDEALALIQYRIRGKYEPT